MPGIEFVGADTGGDAGDDVLDTGPRRPVPRWVWLVAALVVVAVGISVLVSSRSDDTPAARRATPTPVPSEPSVAAPVEQVTALTSDGTSLFWVAGNKLFRAGPVGRISVSTLISPTGGDFAELQLVPDAAERLIWVVSHGSADSNGGAGNVEAFDTSDLHRVVRASAQSLIGGAAVLGRALYVLASGRLLRIASGGSGFTPVARIEAHAHDLVVVNGALLYVEGGNGNAVGRWTPAGVQKPTVLNTTDSSLAAIGPTVFVAGRRGGHAVLDTFLGPRLLPGIRGVATGLTGALYLVATGRVALIALGNGRRGLELACLRVANPYGVIDGPYPTATATSGNVTVLGGTVFQAVGGSVRPVTFGSGGCVA